MRALAIALLCAACGDGAPRPIAFEEYGVEAPAALCAWAVRCRHVPDDATCRRLLDGKRYDTRRAADGIRLGRLAYDAGAAAACLAAGRAAECSSPPFLDASCGRVFTGLVREGGACTGAFDCAGGGECREPVCAAGCCAGRCGPPATPVAAPALAGAGEPCASHFDCVDTAYCEIDGRCHALPRRAGEHCLFGCYFGDLTCDVDSETCLRYAGLGEPCGPGAPCNPGYAFCDGTCRPRPGAGEPCDDQVRRCVPGTRCLAGSCAPRGAAGAACASDDDCEVACDTIAATCAAYMTCEAGGS